MCFFNSSAGRLFPRQQWQAAAHRYRPSQEERGGESQQVGSYPCHWPKSHLKIDRFKEEVRKYAVDHTFKETAKKFGIHHSTVSGWVKESEKQDKCAHFGDFFREKGEKGKWPPWQYE